MVDTAPDEPEENLWLCQQCERAEERKEVADVQRSVNQATILDMFSQILSQNAATSQNIQQLREEQVQHLGRLRESVEELQEGSIRQNKKLVEIEERCRANTEELHSSVKSISISFAESVEKHR